MKLYYLSLVACMLMSSCASFKKAVKETPIGQVSQDQWSAIAKASAKAASDAALAALAKALEENQAQQPDPAK